ncbi:MAG: helix-turn-helix domain-containing protein [Stackebrandtia sp.]
MFVVVRPSSPALRPFVEHLWYFESTASPGRERVFPSGAAQLLVNLDFDELRSYDPRDGGVAQRSSGAALQGASSRPHVIDAGDLRSIAGVAFRPGGTVPFFDEPADAVRDELADLSTLWGRGGAVLPERLTEAPDPHDRIRLLEQALLERLRRPASPATRVALAALDRGTPVAEVADRLGATPRRFAERFAADVGLTPKRFARVRRFQRLLADVVAREPEDWARLAAEHGYYDQAHMIHDFQAFTGITPTRYRPRSAGERNHLSLESGFLQSPASEAGHARRHEHTTHSRPLPAPGRQRRGGRARLLRQGVRRA